jgi:hypothetical protein
MSRRSFSVGEQLRGPVHEPAVAELRPAAVGVDGVDAEAGGRVVGASCLTVIFETNAHRRPGRVQRLQEPLIERGSMDPVREIRDADLEIDGRQLARDDPDMPIEMLAKRAELHREGTAVAAGGAEPDQPEARPLTRPQQAMGGSEAREHARVDAERRRHTLQMPPSIHVVIVATARGPARVEKPRSAPLTR